MEINYHPKIIRKNKINTKFLVSGSDKMNTTKKINFKSFLFEKLYFYISENIKDITKIQVKIIENSG